MPRHPDSSGSTPKSAISLLREKDETISLLRARIVGQKVSLCGFDIASPDPIVNKMGKLLKASVTNFLVNWYGLKVVPLGQKAHIIVANEATPEMILKLVRQGTTNRKSPTILVLCSHSSRFDRNLSETGSTGNIGFVAKPVGPLKLARALSQCMEGVGPTSTTPGLLDPSSATESNDLSNVFEELSISPHSGEILDNSRMAADSDNARKAIESPTPNAMTEKHQEFPFPIEDRPPALPKHHSMPGDKESLAPLTGGEKPPSAALVLTKMEKSITITAPTPSSEPPSSTLTARLHSPRLLLVDDNKINLTLLRTYMRKRKYEVVDEAENGLEAVTKFQNREEGYDIIFMDISMPVLDGFGATRQIRAIEEVRRRGAVEKGNFGYKSPPAPLSPTTKTPSNKSRGGSDEVGEKETGIRSPALVIALTGLASSRDQSEAFTSGIDLFLTKPVAFKEVGKMLDNWEANRERDSRGSLGSEEEGLGGG